MPLVTFRAQADARPGTTHGKDTTLMRKLLALALAALATVATVIWEGGKWIVRAIRPPAPQVAGAAAVEDALEEIAQAQAEPARHWTNPDTSQFCWGQTAFRYALAARAGTEEPGLNILDPEAEAWLRGLSDRELELVVDYGPARIRDHIWGSRPIAGMTPCMVRPEDPAADWTVRTYWRAPPPVLTEDQRMTCEILEDLMTDEQTAHHP